MRIIIFFLSIIISNFIFGQNLVTNPSFESYSLCPDGIGEIYLVSGWSKAGFGTPDYYNSCAPLFELNFSSILGASIPKNNMGYQYAATGNGYCGFYNMDKVTPNYREVIISKLITPLITGVKYYISFKVSLAEFDGYHYVSSDHMGVRFTNYDYSFSNQPIIDNISHVFSNVIVTDTLGWQTIRGSFVSGSNYQYIMIGNFFDDLSTNANDSNGLFPYISYYYLDDICVSTDSLECYNTVGIKKVGIKNKLSIYPNPSSGKVTIKIEGVSNNSLEIYDIMGRKIMNKVNFKNEYRINLTRHPKGIYLLKITSGNTMYTKNIIYR